MNKKLIIMAVIVLAVVAGGVFWQGQEKEGIEKEAANEEKTLEERIKEENPEVARRLEEGEKTKENEKVATSLAKLSSFKVPEKCLDAGFISCDSSGVCKLDDGTICTKAINLQGYTNKETDTFILENEKEGVGLDFYIILGKLPLTEKNPSYIISAYKVGEKEPVYTHSNITTLKQLKDMNWVPEKYTPTGTVGGIANSWIKGPGEFYFKIEVENVDEWLLKLRKGLITEFTG